MLANDAWNPDAVVMLPVAPAERRRSARIPLDGPVRIGPPGGIPYATVSARDLSAGGIFFDAEREVRVGARFSIEIPIGSGERIYVSEAEVVDNRSRRDGGGFGARFVALSDETRHRLEAVVAERAYVTLRSAPAEAEPTRHDALPSEPGFGETARALSGRPARREGASGRGDGVEAPTLTVATGAEEDVPGLDPRALPTLLVRARSRWTKMHAWLRSFPLVSGALFVSAAAAVVVVGLVVPWSSPTVAVPPVLEAPRTVDDATHARLVEAADPAGISTPAAVESPGAIVNPLPSVDAPLPEREVADGDAPREPTVAARGEAAVSAPTAPPAPRAPPSVGERREPAKRAPRAAAPESGRPPEGVQRATAPRASEAAGRLVVDVGDGAIVRRQYVLHRPERFVVDVAGVKGRPRLPDATGRVVRVRQGRHEGFVRFVVDVGAPLESGRASVVDGRLELGLRFR